MCLFKYREKRYGKLTLILTGLIILALAAASFIGGIYAFKTINNWGKYALLVVLIIVGIVTMILTQDEIFCALNVESTIFVQNVANVIAIKK